MRTTFIYGLFDPRTNELRYIGKSNNPKRRLQEHLICARYKKGHNKYLYAWMGNLLSCNLEPSLQILEEVPIENWQQFEIAYINKYRDLGFRLTNITNGGDGGYGFFLTEEQELKRQEAVKKANTGKKATEEKRLKMSLSHKGQRPSEETRKKLSESQKGKNTWSKGRKMSQETIEKISASNRGKKMSDEFKRKMSESRKGVGNPMFGKTRSEETREKASKSLKGRIFTEEHRANLSAALKGHNVPLEARNKWSELFTGKKLSDETKQKMSEGQKRRRERERENRSD